LFACRRSDLSISFIEPLLPILLALGKYSIAQTAIRIVFLRHLSCAFLAIFDALNWHCFCIGGFIIKRFIGFDMSASSLLSNISGIHSKQPFFVLNSEYFLTHLTPENPEVSHFYSFKAGSLQTPIIVVPDGCIDIIFNCDSGSPVGQVCGTKLEAGEVSFVPGQRYFGVRFVAGIIPDFLTISAQELIGHELDLRDVAVNSEPLVEQVINSANFAQQVSAVNRFLSNRKRRSRSQVTSQIIAKIRQQKGNIQVQDLEKFSGYTTRTLQRMFKNDIGLSPKGFSRAIRCQSAIYSINHGNEQTFSDFALDLGFSDQSHFLKEFKKLVNVTPQEYQNRIKEKAYLERIHCC